MTPLAALGQLNDRTATVFDAGRALKALGDASSAVRAYTGQTFTRVTTTDRLRARWGWVRLSQRPVHDVTAVTRVDGTDVAFTWDGLDRVELTAGGLGPLVPPNPPVVDVTYDHGYDPGDIPDDLVGVVCAMAARGLGTPPEVSGVNTESITNYSVTLGPVGAAGAVGLFASEQAILDRYRRLGRAVSVW